MKYTHDYLLNDEKILQNEKKTRLVLGLTLITMFAEVIFGYVTGSMALLADGWHMGSHVVALGISLLAYALAKSPIMKTKFSFGTGKFVPLGGYSSAILLAIVAFAMIVQSLERFINPVDIDFSVAIFVVIIGLAVNLISALILWDHHDDHHHEEHSDHVHDHNHHSVLMHVIADAFTSVLALVALIAGKYMGWFWADPLIGIVGAVVILKWAYGLIKSTGHELLDGHSKTIDHESIETIIAEIPNALVTDLHIWRIAPNAHACEHCCSE